MATTNPLFAQANQMAAVIPMLYTLEEKKRRVSVLLATLNQALRGESCYQTTKKKF